MNGEIIAEGTLLSNDLTPAGNGIFAPGTYSVEVLKDPLDASSWPHVGEVHDVIVVVHANEYSVGDFQN